MEQYTLTGKIDKQICIFDIGRFKGTGSKVDQKTFVIHGTTYGSEGQVLSDFYGTMFFLTPLHRIRNYSYLQDDVLKSVRWADEHKV